MADPLAVFENPPELEPPDLLADLPPFERRSYDMQGVMRAVENELARLEAARQALIENCFPGTADVLLTGFELLLGIPADPALALEDRRRIVLTYMQNLNSEGTGLEWEASITSLVGTNWNHAENDPASYTVHVAIPENWADVGWPVIRAITPAHLAIDQAYTGGFLLDDPASLVDEDDL